MQQQQSQQLVDIYRDFAKARTFSFRFIKLLIMRYKRQDEASNGDSVKIQPVVCKDNTYFKKNSVSLV